MAYSIPEFPLTCMLYDNSGGFVGNPRAEEPCNLAYGKRTLMQFWPWVDTPDASIFGWLLLPAGTDVRDPFTPMGADFVEVPKDTGRMYQVVYVDDYALGFPNEHRFAVLRKTGSWPVPLPPVFGS